MPGASDPWEPVALAAAGDGLVLAGRATVQGVVRAVVYRLNAKGKLLWDAWPLVKTWPAGPPVALVGHADGSATVLSRLTSPQATAWVSRVQADGKQGWSKELPGTTVDHVGGGDMAALPDGAVWVGFGSVYDDQFHLRIAVHRLDSNGQATVLSTLPLARLDRLQPTPDGGFLALGALDLTNQGPHRRLVLASADGQVRWFRDLPVTFDEADQLSPHLLEPLPDGDWLAGGSASSKTAWLARLAPTGRIRWLRQRTFPGRPTLRVAFPLPNGKVQVAGAVDLQPLTWQLDRYGNTYCGEAMACADVQCDDGDPCTQDLCTGQGCLHAPVPPSVCQGPACPAACPGETVP